MAENQRITPLVKKVALDVQLKSMVRRNVAEILQIEKGSSEFPWSEKDFLVCLNKRMCIGMVVEYENRIIGFMVYELFQERLELLKFAVTKDYRRKGVGSQMIQMLRNKLAQQRRNEIRLKIQDTNLYGQLFFRDQGFVACRVIWNYHGKNKDAYLMRFLNDQKREVSFMYNRNRITKYYRRYHET